MPLNIFGYKIDLEILIFIAVLYLILLVHTLIGVVRVEGVDQFLKEGFDTLFR